MDKKDKAIFLDRDGVITVDSGYPYRREDFELVEGAGAALRRAQDAGYKLLVVTNQGGIGLGYFTHDDLHGFHEHMTGVLEEEHGVHIDDIAYCPHHPDAGDVCDCRKPSPRMIFDLSRRHKIDLGKSAMIGDRDTDMQAAKAARVQGFLFTGGSLDVLMSEVLDVLEP